MFKKVLISAIIVTAVFAAGSAVYAQSEMDGRRYGKNTAPVFELLSDKEESKTFSGEYVVSGNASEGTKITIHLYWFKAEDEKSIISTKKPDEDSENKGSWILQESEEMVIGPSGIFAESVSLNIGKNRIVLFIRDINGKTDEVTLEFERFLEEQVNKEVSGDFMNSFVEDLLNSINADE